MCIQTKVIMLPDLCVFACVSVRACVCVCMRKIELKIWGCWGRLVHNQP